MSLQLYARATEHARARGIIIADTKFEFGLDADGKLVADRRGADARLVALLARRHVSAGRTPPSFDKQYVRDYLETLDWGKTAPGPRLPAVVIERTRAKYYEALHRLADDSRE